MLQSKAICFKRQDVSTSLRILTPYREMFQSAAIKRNFMKKLYNASASNNLYSRKKNFTLTPLTGVKI